MIKKIFLILSLFFHAFLYAENIDLTQFADGMLIKDINKKNTIFSFNENKKISPASLTKIMTAIIAIESKKLNEKVLITKEMLNVEPSKIGLKEGEIVYLKDLVYTLLISSSNDCAKAISIYLGNNNEQKFIFEMNRKAKRLGMYNTNYTNSSGFDIGEHYTTLEDLMTLSEYAIKNKIFNDIVKLQEYKFKSLNSNKIFISKTHNKLLNKYEYAVGIKTGYTKKAGPCLIARVKKDNKDLILIMVNSKLDRWETAKSIFDILIS